MTSFDPTREPIRAIRDLIVAYETSDAFGLGDRAEADVLERARDAFTVLRRIFGDHRPAEDIEAGPMIEPDITSVPALTRALSNILDAANEALEGTTS